MYSKISRTYRVSILKKNAFIQGIPLHPLSQSLSQIQFPPGLKWQRALWRDLVARTVAAIATAPNVAASLYVPVSQDTS